MAGLCERGNELSGSINFVEYFGQLSNSSFLKEVSVPWS
jgi:hypothetical protein